MTIIGDPDAAPGAIQVHVVYPAAAPTVAETDYPMLVRLFAAHLVAHADQYDRPWPRTAEERRTMAQPEELAGTMPEKLDTMRDALRTMVHRRQKGGAVT